jgi:hypothetical protein
VDVRACRRAGESLVGSAEMDSSAFVDQHLFCNNTLAKSLDSPMALSGSDVAIPGARSQTVATRRLFLAHRDEFVAR